MPTHGAIISGRSPEGVLHGSIRRFLVVALTLMLAGCDSTSFQSPPGHSLLQCDEAWKGVWRLDDEKESQDVLVVKDDCQSAAMTSASERDASVTEESVQLRFAEHQGQRYVFTAEDQAEERAERANESGQRPLPSTYTIAQYELAQDSIAIRMVDTRVAARMIVDGQLLGTVSREKDSLRVLVHGTPEDTLRALEIPGLFAAEPTFLLERSTRSVDEFDAKRRDAPSN